MLDVVVHMLILQTGKKKEIINSRKEDDTCFQYAVTIALNYGEINLKFNVPNEIPAVFHNGSNYGYHFIVKELANESEGKFECIGENPEKHKKFSVPVEKKITNIDKDGDESVVTVSYKTKFIDSARFIVTS